MASIRLRREIVGVRVELTRAEVYGLVNTAKRLQELLPSHPTPPVDVRRVFEDEQAREELQQFFHVARAVAPMIDAELTGRDDD